MPTPAWAMTEINALDRDQFVARLGGLFEGSPWIAERAWETLPWESVAALHAALVGVVTNAGEAQQLELIRAHPDLVGRAALAGTLTAESTAEQRAAGLDPDTLSETEVAEFQSANAAYQQTFGFPFVICARENRKETILSGLRERVQHSREVEIETALAEIGKIAWHRLTDLVRDTTVSGRDAMANGPYRLQVSYGKQGVAVYRVHATPLRHLTPIPESAFTGRENTLLACEIGVEVFGDEFIPAYTHGDNATVVATDSMKNFIIRESLAYPGSTMEGLLFHLGAGLANRYPQIHTLTVSGREIPFTAAVIPDDRGGFQPGDNLFTHGSDRAYAEVDLDQRAEQIIITGHRCGIRGMAMMKLTGSAFTSFVRDDYTTLPERGDRPLYIHLDVGWRYLDPGDMLEPDRGRYVPAEQMRDLLAVTFDDFVSESIQHLVHEMGSRALERFPQLAEISFDAQNRTRDPHGQRENDPRVRVYSDPFPAFGRLTLIMSRDNDQ